MVIDYANFVLANLENCHFGSLRKSEASTEVCCAGSKFNKACCKNTWFGVFHGQASDFTDAELIGAAFARESVLVGCKFGNASLQDADLSQVALTSASFHGTIMNSKTILHNATFDVLPLLPPRIFGKPGGESWLLATVFRRMLGDDGDDGDDGVDGDDGDDGDDGADDQDHGDDADAEDNGAQSVCTNLYNKCAAYTELRATEGAQDLEEQIRALVEQKASQVNAKGEVRALNTKLRKLTEQAQAQSTNPQLFGKVQLLLEELSNDEISKRTGFDMDSLGNLCYLIWNVSPSSLQQTLVELEHISKRLKEINDLSVTNETFQDVSSSIHSLYSMRDQVEGELAYRVLQNIFNSSENVRQALGMAFQLQEIVVAADRECVGPPPELLSKIRFASKVFKTKQYTWLKRIQGEVVKVERVQRYQSNLSSALSSLFLAFMIGLSNFVVTLLCDEYIKEHPHAAQHPVEIITSSASWAIKHPAHAVTMVFMKCWMVALVVVCVILGCCFGNAVKRSMCKGRSRNNKVILADGAANVAILADGAANV